MPKDRKYIRTFRPDVEFDRRFMQSVLYRYKLLGTDDHFIEHLPLSDPDKDGNRTRFPAGEDVWTSCGWNNFVECSSLLLEKKQEVVFEFIG